VMCPVRPALQGSVEKLIERPACDAIAQKSMAGSPGSRACARGARSRISLHPGGSPPTARVGWLEGQSRCVGGCS
jgi:hypothetical protein